MKINTKFSIGDEFFHVAEEREPLLIPCNGCRTGLIKLLDGKDYACPKCKGNGKLTQPGRIKHVIVRAMVTVITAVVKNLGATKDFCPDPEPPVVNYAFWRERDCFSYSYSEPDLVGAVAEGKVFRTRAEAQAHIDGLDLTVMVG